MLLQNVIYILTFIGLGSLFALALLRKRNRQMLRFANLVALIASWLLLQWVGGLLGGEKGELLIRASVGISSYVVLSFLKFVYEYCGEQINTNINTLLNLISAIFFVISIFGVSVIGVEFNDYSPSISSVSFTYYLQITFIIFLAFMATLKLGKRIKKDNSDADKLLVTGLLQALITSVFVSTLFASSNEAQILIPLSLLLMCFIVYYAIARHKLFDIRRVIARAMAYGLSLIIIVISYAVLSSVVAGLILGVNFSIQQEIVLAVFGAIVGLAFQPLKSFFDKLTVNVFYQDQYNPQNVINNINSVLVSSAKLEDILKMASDIIESELKVSYADFYLDPRASLEFHLVGSNSKLFASPEWKSFTKGFDGSKQKIIALPDTLPNNLIASSMRLLEIDCCIKMESNGDGVGYLIVGPRKSGSALSTQDIQLLEIIADEVAIAAQNALRYEEISQFNETLRMNIDEATRELQKSNEKLKQLDEAKDEFISMASHQLRTPLTSVKGYISMMLEGDAGEINETQRKFLDQAYVSSQRMVYLIADLLNVSRLKTGKFIIEPAPTYLPDVVESEIAQLYETAKARELELIFHKPDSFPELNLDETKIRQVIMNFADNAIYYTPRGGKIKLELKQKQSSVEFTVSDNGIGVPKNEQHRLFTKFYRAGNARKARPDGTGLGLFMAKKVVIAQGGAIIFRTSEGKGSTFGFSFPRAKLEVND